MARSIGPLSAVALRVVSPAAVVVSAAACGGDVTARAQPVTAWPSAPANESWELVSTADRTRFLASLDKIDPRLTENDGGALSVAVTICFQVYDKETTDVVRAVTRKEYANVVAKLSSEKADDILAAVKKWICSSRGLYLHSQT